MPQVPQSHWKLTVDERQALEAFLRKLVQTPSLPGDEGEVAALVMDEMRRLGYDDVQMDAAGNVIGRVGPPEGPGLMFDSHMDTVTVSDRDAWTVDPWGAEVRDGRLYGLGACDMKGGLAATVYGAAALRQRGPDLKGPIWVACVGLEEPSEGTCTRILFEEDQMDAQWVVIAEPSSLNVVRAQRGHVEMKLNIQGKSAHSSAPQLGVNAIYAAARILFGLEMLADQLPNDPFLGPGVLAVTDITSHAVSRNAVPHRCELTLDRRLTLGETESSVLLEVERVIAREDVDARVAIIEEEVTTHTGEVRRARRASLPWALDERHPLVMAMQAAARDVGLRPTLTKWPFATEGTYTACIAQIPTVGFGPGDPTRPHTVDEFIELRDVHAAASAYAALGTRLLGS